MLHKPTLSVFMVSLLAIMLFVGAVPAFANNFNGGIRSVSLCTGASATIETCNPTVGGGGASSAWPMVVGQNTSVQQYVQVGWAKDAPATQPSYFYEYCNDLNGTWYLKWLGTATTGSNNNFMVGRDSSTWYFKINGTSYGTVSVASLGITGSRSDFLGEGRYWADHCPGTASNPCTIGNLQYKDSSYVWHSTSVQTPINSDPSIFANNVSVGSTIFEIWDKR